MTDADRSRRFRLAPWPILLLSFVFVFGAAMSAWGPVNLLAWRGGEFPDIDPERPTYQQRIAEIGREQYGEQPDGARYFSRGDEVAVLDDGSSAPEGRWDAAFVSWVLNEAGLPVRPETAGDVDAWLIDDPLELAGAMADRGAYIDADDEPEFSPQIGDLIFYDYPGPFGHHVNIVVAVSGDVVTVGGDELGRVGLAHMNLRNRSGIMGWGATGRLEDPIAPEPSAAAGDTGDAGSAEAPNDGTNGEYGEADPEFASDPTATPADAPR